MSKKSGIYYNTSPEPVFYEGTLIGGHEHVFIDSYTRLPGHFVKIDDPQDDPNAPEQYKRAYAALTAKAEEEAKETSANSPSRRTSVVMSDKEEKPARTARKGKRDSSADAGDNQ